MDLIPFFFGTDLWYVVITTVVGVVGFWLQNRMKRSRQQADSHYEMITTLNTQVAALTKTTEESAQDRRRLEEKLESVNTSLVNALQRTTDLQDEIAEKEAQLRDMDNLRARMDFQEQELNTLRSKYADTERQYKAALEEIKDLNAKIITLTHERNIALAELMGVTRVLQAFPGVKADLKLSTTDLEVVHDEH